MPTISWQVEDGYAGGSRPHSTKIPQDEWDDCETEEEKNELIEDYVQHDFEQTISWCILSIDEG